MPIASGAKGMPGILAIPGQVRFGTSSIRGRIPFRSRPLDTVNPRITGVTRDSTGTILGSCMVDLFRTVDDVKVDSYTSDATTGVYTLSAVGPGPFYVVAYKSGAPDVAGTTVNTLQAS